MSDSVTKTSSQSWFSRLGGAVAGVLVGVFLVFAAFPLLTWNEARAIKRIKTLQAGSKDVVSVPASPVTPANEGRLVHVTGNLAASKPVADRNFGVSAAAIKLRRNVEMYQWTEEEKSETKKKLGGGEETVKTSTYEKKWSPTVVDSSGFESKDGHTNPTEMPVEGETFTANPVTVGAFTLADRLVDKLDDFHALPVGDKERPAITTRLSMPVQVADGGFYLGENPKEPHVGDARIRFEVIDPGAVSIIARQIQDTFEPYTIKGLGSIELLQTGTVSAEGMFTRELQGNTIITWLIRLGGFLMMFFGILLIANPISVFADVIPFLGDLLGVGIGLIAFLVAASLSFVTIAVAWLAFRPLIGIPLLVVAVGCAVLGFRIIGKRKALKTAAA